MIFKIYDSEAVARVFFKGYFFGSLFLGLIALYGLASGAGILSTLSGFAYIVIASLLSLNKRFRRSPFSILFCFFTFLFLNIPAAFILVEGSDYIYGEGLTSISFAQSDYQQSLPLGFLYLSVFWFAMWLAIISARARRRNINQESFSSISPMHILLLGIIVLVVTWIDNQSITDVRLGGAEHINSLLAFIFFDHAYLVMAGLILFYKLNEPAHVVNSKRIAMLVSALLIGFTFIQFIAGSKAAILTTFILLVFFPFSIFREYPHAQVPFPSPKFLVVIVFLTLPLFYIALIQRISLGSAIAPDFGTLLAGISEIDASVVYDIANQIFYRFSQGGIDRFLLIFQSFVINSFDPATSREYVIYLAKNTLNLLLPGTPFPESYVPSSQLFAQVLEKNLVGWDLDSSALLIQLNSQPYTIFGVFIIIFNFTAPAVLYLFTFVFIFVFNRMSHIFSKITMLYFFAGALSSYGIEIAIGNSAHLFVSILIMYFLLKLFSRFHTKLAVKSNRIHSPAPT